MVVHSTISFTQLQPTSPSEDNVGENEAFLYRTHPCHILIVSRNEGVYKMTYVFLAQTSKSFDGIRLKVPNWWKILLKSKETSIWSAETKLLKQKIVIYHISNKEDLWWMSSSPVPGTSGPWLVQLLQDLISWGAKVFSPPLGSLTAPTKFKSLTSPEGFIYSPLCTP